MEKTGYRLPKCYYIPFYLVLNSSTMSNNPSTFQDDDFKERIRGNAATFHKNFSAGAFEKNGPLVTENVYVMPLLSGVKIL
jgi:hypothetical protein